MEIPSEIYDPGREDDTRLDERGGASALTPSDAAQKLFKVGEDLYG